MRLRLSQTKRYSAPLKPNSDGIIKGTSRAFQKIIVSVAARSLKHYLRAIESRRLPFLPNRSKGEDDRLKNEEHALSPIEVCRRGHKNGDTAESYYSKGGNSFLW